MTHFEQLLLPTLPAITDWAKIMSSAKFGYIQYIIWFLHPAPPTYFYYTEEEEDGGLRN